MTRTSKERIISILNKDLGPRSISPRLMSLFLKQLSLLLNSGISLSESLKILKSQNIDKKINKALDIIIKNLNMGNSPYYSFYQAKEYFSPMLLAFIDTGNETGKFASILNDLSDFIYEDSKNKSVIKQAMTYPLILLIVTFFVIISIMRFVMPSFIEIFDRAEVTLPKITRILIGIYNFLSGNFLLILLFFILLILIIRLLKTDYKKKVMIDKATYKLLNLNGFARLRMEYQLTNLYYILKVGNIDQIRSLGIIRDSYKNAYIKETFNDIIFDINKGNSLYYSFNKSGIFSPLFLSMIKIGEKTGKLDQTLKRSNTYYTNEYMYKMKRIASLTEPIMVLIMSLLVAFVVFSVALPMFDSVNIGV